MSSCLVVLNYNDSERSYNVIKNGMKKLLFDHFVLIDNGSDKDELAKIKGYNLENIVFIENTRNMGYGAGHNVGLRYAVEVLKSDFIFLIVSDIEYSTELIMGCIDEMKKNPQIGVLSARMLEMDGTEGRSAWKEPQYIDYLLWCYPFLRKYMSNQFYEYDESNVIDVDVIRGSFLCFRASAIYAAGYFDEKVFLYNEENIICNKIKGAGYKVCQLTHLFYKHNHVRQVSRQRKKWVRIKMECESGIYYMNKYKNINGFKLKILKMSNFILCIYRYIGNRIT